jgi:hypothetical protein
MTDVALTIAVDASIGGESISAFLRRNMEDLAVYRDARGVSEGRFNIIKDRLLERLFELIDGMRFERAKGADGSALVASDGSQLFALSIDTKVCAAAFEAAKRDCDSFH